MSTKDQIQPAARQLREQSLLLEVYCDDEKITFNACKKILLVARCLARFKRTRAWVGRLLTVTRNLDMAAKLLVIVHGPDKSGKKTKAARKLLNMLGKAEVPRRLIAIARALEHSESRPLKKPGARIRTTPR